MRMLDVASSRPTMERRSDHAIATVRKPSPRSRGEAPLLSVEGLRVTFEDRDTGETTEAVGGVDLTIGPGEFVTVVGLSGCGKSTLLNVLAGLVAPSAGVLQLEGRSIHGPSRDIAVVFQKPSLLPWRSVLDNVTYGLELRGVSRAAAREQAGAFVDLVELTRVAHFKPHALSGGMQQRVNLARALACDPKLLLLDEPFAALDAITRETMQDELLRIWQATRKSVLMVTHQIDEAVLLSDRVIVFSDRPGTVLADVEIDLPRPRDGRVRESTKFSRLTTEIWGLIHATAAARQGVRS
jgi:NitT/TauT family transport system ATP-binding protein